ncbi:MAG: hypothetical protein ACK5LC_14385 [Coprobacillaceae bacterium]
MNNYEMMNEITKETKVEQETCRMVLKAYEKYGEKNVLRMKAKHMEGIVGYIHEETSIPSVEVESVMSTFFKTTRREIRNRVPFVKKEN